MKFSICIPNFNYERYIARTIRSALQQDGAELEVVVADNASTDGSVAAIRAIDDPRVAVTVNECNVGFAGNLDRAARMASGEWMILLSSDDLMRPGALATYGKLIAALGDRAVAISSTMDKIDPDDAITGRIGPDPELWRDDDVDDALSRLLAARVYRVPATTLLRRCLETMKTPFNFAATCYRREDYRRVEGYGGGRLINPDKWFHWRLLGAVEDAIFIDAPLFAYRWHPQNQTAQQAREGALKFLVDEYSSTLELSPALLERVGLRRDDLVRAFVRNDVIDHGLATLGRGDRNRAHRILRFGDAAYPGAMSADRRSYVLRILLAGGVLGECIAGVAYRAKLRHSRGDRS